MTGNNAMPQFTSPTALSHDFLTGEGQMAELIRRYDWAQTPLGPLHQWPQSLRTAVSICLHSRYPMFVWWGRELTNLYNDAYISVLGQRHPQALGQPVLLPDDEMARVLTAHFYAKVPPLLVELANDRELPAAAPLPATWPSHRISTRASVTS